ncbi:MAG: EamA/RhaT family transporter, partial [Thioclava marina]|nr:EamA/RhaT family transporter [Thioclava marina]
MAPSAHPAPDHPGLGVVFMLSAFSMLTLMDAFAKLLGEGYHPLLIVWARFAVNAVVLAAIYRGSLPVRMRS